MKKRAHNFIDITNKRFGRLLVINIAYIKNRTVYWECLCDCGNTKNVRGADLRNGAIKSCTCLHKEIVSKNFTKHGMSNTKAYVVWSGMKDRCYNKNHNDYKHYGGRGITVCEKWLESFSNFYKDMGSVPPHHVIDRIDYNKGYFPENCRWVTIKESHQNTRRNKFVTIGNETKCLSEWHKILGFNYSVVLYRMNKNNLSFADALHASTCKKFKKLGT